MKYSNLIQVVFFFAVLAWMSYCKEKGKKTHPEAASVSEAVSIPSGYDLGNGKSFPMKASLKEISGIHFLKENLFAAIEDEHAKIYTVDFESGDLGSEIDFGAGADYEDITMNDEFYFVLQSNGKIYQIPRSGDASQAKEFSMPGASKMEFETLYLDDSNEKLVLVCKSCPGEKKGGGINAYGFDLGKGEFDTEPLFSIEADASIPVAKGKRGGFRPSAAAIHPIEKKLYVLCSIGKLLLVCDLQGKIENALALDPAIYKQPEGIAFKPNGDMFISNEGGNGVANIVKLPYSAK